MKRFLEQVALLLAETDASTVEKALISKEILDHAYDWSICLNFLFFVITTLRLDKEGNCLFDVGGKVLCLAAIVTIDSVHDEELREVMSVADQERDFLKLL